MLTGRRLDPHPLRERESPRTLASSQARAYAHQASAVRGDDAQGPAASGMVSPAKYRSLTRAATCGSSRSSRSRASSRASRSSGRSGAANASGSRSRRSPAPPRLRRRLLAGVVDEDAAHGLGGGREEVARRCVEPLVADQPQVGLVDQGRRLQGVARPSRRPAGRRRGRAARRTRAGAGRRRPAGRRPRPRPTGGSRRTCWEGMPPRPGTQGPRGPGGDRVERVTDPSVARTRHRPGAGGAGAGGEFLAVRPRRPLLLDPRAAGSSEPVATAPGPGLLPGRRPPQAGTSPPVRSVGPGPGWSAAEPAGRRAPAGRPGGLGQGGREQVGQERGGRTQVGQKAAGRVGPPACGEERSRSAQAGRGRCRAGWGLLGGKDPTGRRSIAGRDAAAINANGPRPRSRSPGCCTRTRASRGRRSCRRPRRPCRRRRRTGRCPR